MILSSSLYSFGNSGGVFCSCSQINFKTYASYTWFVVFVLPMIQGLVNISENVQKTSNNVQKSSASFEIFFFNLQMEIWQSWKGLLVIVRGVQKYFSDICWSMEGFGRFSKEEICSLWKVLGEFRPPSKYLRWLSVVFILTSEILVCTPFSQSESSIFFIRNLTSSN